MRRASMGRPRAGMGGSPRLCDVKCPSADEDTRRASMGGEGPAEEASTVVKASSSRQRQSNAWWTDGVTPDKDTSFNADSSRMSPEGLGERRQSTWWWVRPQCDSPCSDKAELEGVASDRGAERSPL